MQALPCAAEFNWLKQLITNHQNQKMIHPLELPQQLIITRHIRYISMTGGTRKCCLTISRQVIDTSQPVLTLSLEFTFQGSTFIIIIIKLSMRCQAPSVARATSIALI